MCVWIIDYRRYGNSKLLLIYPYFHSCKEIRTLLVPLKRRETKTTISFCLWSLELSVTHSIFRLRSTLDPYDEELWQRLLVAESTLLYFSGN